MHSDMLSREDYNNFLRDKKRPKKEDTLKKMLQNLIIEIDKLQIPEPEEKDDYFEQFNAGVIRSRNLIIREIGRISCPVCLAREQAKETEDAIYLQD